MARDLTMVPRPRPRPASIERRARVYSISGDQAATASDFVMPTLHNWVEQVYKAFGQTFPTGAKELVLLGVREMSRTVAEGEEDDYGRSSREADRGDTSSHTSGSGNVSIIETTTRFDDLLFAVWTDTKPEDGTKARVYRCTLDAGSDLPGTTGTPYLLEGQAYLTKPGLHWGKPGSLHAYKGSYPTILLARDATKSARVFGGEENALVGPNRSAGPERWEFCAEEQNNTIHIHWSKDTSTQVKNWSAGCTVLNYDKTGSVYQGFRDVFEAAANKSQIPYLVVSSSYVQLPDRWMAQAKQQPKYLGDPSSVISKSGLTMSPDRSGYLPSIMTYSFAEAVLGLATALDNLTANVGSNSGSSQAIDGSLADVLTHSDRLTDRVVAALNRWRQARANAQPASAADQALLSVELPLLSERLRISLARSTFTTTV